MVMLIIFLEFSLHFRVFEHFCMILDKNVISTHLTRIIETVTLGYLPSSDCSASDFCRKHFCRVDEHDVETPGGTEFSDQ